MAIKDISRKPYIDDNDTNVKIGIDLPIRRDDAKGGWFATTDTTIEAVKNNIRMLLQTNKGERLFHPNLGVDLRNILFEQITEETTVVIEDLILDVLSFWMPFVEVRNILVETMDSNKVVGANEIRIKILFNIKKDPNTTNSIVINFSSDINEDMT